MHSRKVGRKMYLFDDEVYAGQFPEEWAETHLPNTGPKECKVCEYYGTWNGGFVTYCRKCAVDIYHGERGGGVGGYLCDGEMGDPEDIRAAQNTYLEGIPMNDIGDREVFDTLAMLFSAETAIRMGTWTLAEVSGEIHVE